MNIVGMVSLGRAGQELPSQSRTRGLAAKSAVRLATVDCGILSVHYGALLATVRTSLLLPIGSRERPPVLLR